MSREARTTLFFGDGDHEFRLGIAELEELQEKTDCGPAVLMARLRDGVWRLADVVQTLRLGLIGAGVDKQVAHDLVKRQVEPGYLLKCAVIAYGVVACALVGVPDEQLKEAAPSGGARGEAAPESRPSPTASSASRSSTGRVRSSATRRKKSAA